MSRRISRRTLLQSTSATMALATVSRRTLGAAPVRQRLTTGWQHHRGSLAHVWEVWRPPGGEAPMPWEPVELPHCFNARDCVDPDAPYYQGQGWYRTYLPPDNPLPRGPPLLPFQGAG